MAARNGEGLHPAMPVIHLPLGEYARIARINFGVIHAWSTERLLGWKITAGTSRSGAISVQGPGYRNIVGGWLDLRSHHAPVVVVGSAWS
jgi:hypothetical protein